MHKCQTICFCFPYQGAVGGVPTLFAGVARQLILKGYSISIVDYEDGTLKRLLEHECKVKFYVYKDNYDLFINDDFIVFQSMVPWSMYPGLIFSEESRLFFWNCHPYNLVPPLPILYEKVLPFYRIYKILIKFFLYSHVVRVRKFVQHIDQMHALVFMDGGNLRNTEYFLDLDIKKPIFLPIPVLPEKSRILAPVSKKIKNICWAGRAVKSKMVPLLDMLGELNLLEETDSYTVYIIGEGEFLDEFKLHVKELANIKVHYYNFMPYNDLIEFVRERVDFCAASGTLALNFSSIGVPTILLDVSLKTMKNRLFRFMYEVEDYSLGDTDFDIQREASKSNLKSQILFLKNSYRLASEKSLNYVAERHSMQSICNLLIENIQKSRFYSTSAVEGKFFSSSALYNVFKFIQDKRKRK
jgi:hypothetical protein